MKTTHILTISVRMNVAVAVDAMRAEDGTVEIASVRGYIGLPDAGEIFEAMDQSGFDMLDAEFEAAEKAAATK